MCVCSACADVCITPVAGEVWRACEAIGGLAFEVEVVGQVIRVGQQFVVAKRHSHVAFQHAVSEAQRMSDAHGAHILVAGGIGLVLFGIPLRWFFAIMEMIYISRSPYREHARLSRGQIELEVKVLVVHHLSLHVYHAKVVGKTGHGVSIIK